MLALAITLLAVATFGILYTAAAQNQNSDGAITGLDPQQQQPRYPGSVLGPIQP
jgi:hypothetical protein